MMIFRMQWLAVGLVLALSAMPAFAQSAKPAPTDDSAKVRLLLDLLADPEVKAWAEKQRAGEKAKDPSATPERGLSGAIAARFNTAQHDLDLLIAAIPTLPDEISRAADTLHRDMGHFGLTRAILLALGFVGIGVLAEWLMGRLLRGMVAGSHTREPASVRERLHAIGLRFCYGTARLIAFALGSIGVFLAFAWPPMLHEVVLAYLGAFVAFRMLMLGFKFLLAPDAVPLRIIPMPTDSARYWSKHLAVLVGWFVFGYATVEINLALGMSYPALRVGAMILAIGLLAIAIDMVWRRPPAAADAPHSRLATMFPGHRASWLLSFYFLLLWGLRAIGAFPVFWLAVVLVAVPAAIRTTRRAVDHMLRPPQGSTEALVVPSLYRVGIERGLRAIWILGGVLVLARGWDVDMVAMGRDDIATRLVRGALSAVVIVLVADFGWQMLKSLIDYRIAVAQDPGQPDTEEARRSARIRTLLPIVKNILFIVFIVMAALMALASMGVEIGPLIAGAGVVGVAVGFGAQTLVRDVISGMFYLLDDAFRVGEYIQSGSNKGTVESFSLRSIKLRHQRGALYTVPFGVLGAIQNMSRDWTIDKAMIGVTYDSDLELAKKLIKQVGKELTEIPEFAPNILETLKMQGIESFGDYAIQLRLKMKTRPGTQFMIRRRAMAMIKKAFDENGIRFAYPTVQVAGGEGGTSTAAAQAALRAIQTPAEGLATQSAAS